MRRVRGSSLLCLASLLTLGCSRTLVLGTECPDEDDFCARESRAPDADGEAPAEDADVLDAGTDGKDAALHDSQVRDSDVRDATGDSNAARDAGNGDVVVPLGLANAGFDRSGGLLGGDLLLNELVNTVLPPLGGVVLANVPSWYACSAFAVSSVSRDVDGGMPGSRDDHLSFAVYDTPAPARQALSMPMKAGTRYALEMDVQALPDNNALLFVSAFGARSDALCPEPLKLGSSKIIENNAVWTTACVQFTADADYNQLMISPGYNGPTPSVGARLWLDNLRQVASCP